MKLGINVKTVKMKEIYYLVIAAISAVGVFLAGVYWKQMVRSIKRLKPRRITKKYRWRNSELTLEQVIGLIEKRLELLDKQNGSFHNRLDSHDVEINNIATTVAKRDKARKHNIRRDVRDYLKELQND